ncbi:MAG TPA: histidine phosphatase family protein [Hyphomicrobium sp.]|nr:histidine phosphatase family protein [Hyphomicrobium sp.]
MALCLLVRHATHDLVDEILCGRSTAAPLSDLGARQALQLVEALKSSPVERIQSSPQQRAIATASPLCRARRLPLEICAPLDEVEFGRWSGKQFRDLEADQGWQRWNTDRTRACTPAGDCMAAVQRRIVSHLQRAGRAWGQTIVMFTHAEVIRAAVLHCRGEPLDAWHAIDIAPASHVVIRANFDETLILDQRLAA